MSHKPWFSKDWTNNVCWSPSALTSTTGLSSIALPFCVTGVDLFYGCTYRAKSSFLIRVSVKSLTCKPWIINAAKFHTKEGSVAGVSTQSKAGIPYTHNHTHTHTHTHRLRETLKTPRNSWMLNVQLLWKWNLPQVALIKHLRFQERISNSETSDVTLIVFVPDKATRNLICHVDSLTFVITGLKLWGTTFQKEGSVPFMRCQLYTCIILSLKKCREDPHSSSIDTALRNLANIDSNRQDSNQINFI